MFTQQTLDNIRGCSIEQVIGLYTKLSRKGANSTGLCPFHGEKTASFTVSEGKGIYKCFGCGAAGDVIQFIREKEHLDFEDAVQKIAGICGIGLEYESNFDKATYETKRAERSSYSEIMNDAWGFYKKYLIGEDANMLQRGKTAKEYLYSRGYNDDIILNWGIGYAPDEWRLLSGAFADKGLLPIAMKLGLCKEKEKGQAYDFFRNRIMIPIMNERGDVVSFGGRTLPGADAEQAKYLNGLQSPIYDKSKTLFGLYQAIPAIKKQKYAVLTEGYMDVISMHMAGAENTVGLCNNRMTHEQAILLKRYTDTVVLLPDNDKKSDGSCPGLDGATKNIEILLEKDLKVYIMPLPDADDDEGRPIKVDADDWSKQFSISE